MKRTKNGGRTTKRSFGENHRNFFFSLNIHKFLIKFGIICSSRLQKTDCAGRMTVQDAGQHVGNIEAPEVILSHLDHVLLDEFHHRHLMEFRIFQEA